MTRRELGNLVAFAIDQAAKVRDGTWRVSVEGLADAFSQEFHCPPAATLAWLKELCSNLDIDIEYRDMPVKGFHHRHARFAGGRRIIFLPKEASDFQTRATILHELGEIVEEEIEAIIGQDFQSAKPEHWWDSFAHAVLLPEKWFRKRLLDSKFDLIGLQKETRLSYAGVLIRTQNVCNLSYPLFTLLFERSKGGSTAESLHFVRISAATWPWRQSSFAEDGINVFRLPHQGSLTPLGLKAREFLAQRKSAVLHVTSEPRGFESVVRVQVPTTSPSAGRLVMIGVPTSHSSLLTNKPLRELDSVPWSYAPVTAPQFGRA